MNKKSRVFQSVRVLTVAAMMTAISIVIGIFCKNLLNFAGGLFRITFENLPIILSGILFGPTVGAFVGAASDLLSYLMSSQIYPPNFIVTAGAVSIGVISGVISKYIVKKKGSAQIVISGIFAHLIGSMIIKSIGLFQFYGYMVLVRIPLYIVIAAVEIIILCWLMKRESFRRLVGYNR